MNKFKVSINSGSHIHHGSGGHHYYFGNKTFYGKVANYSVSQYVLKTNNEQNRNLEEKVENEFSSDIQYGISNLSKHITNMQQLISYVLDVAYKIQQEYGDVNLK